MRKTCLDMVYTLAQRNPRVVFIGSDLSPGLLKEMQDEFPTRYYMEGVAEQNLIGMAAGFAMDGYLPYVNTIATFITRRCYEQVALDLCLHNLPVRLIGNGGGVVYAPLGPTHLAVEDFAILRALPNMAIVAASDAEEMKRLMDVSLDWPGPLYIRLGKGGDPIVSRPEHGFTIGKAIPLRRATRSGHVAIVSTGIMTGHALDAATRLEAAGLSTSVLHVHTVKPLDLPAILEAIEGAALVVTVEEHSRIGGFGSAVLESLAEARPGRLPHVLRLGLPDAFARHYGSQNDLLQLAGLTGPQIAATAQAALAT